MNREIIKRYNAFWNHEETDRPLLFITVPNNTADWKKNSPKTPEDRWENIEARYIWSRFCMENTKFYGEAYPHDHVNFGPGCLAPMMGSNYVIDDNTVWFGRNKLFFNTWDNLDELCLIKDSRMYKMVEDMTRTLAERNNSSYIVGISDLGGNLDILASLRGTMNLLTDIYDYPENILKASQVIDLAWMEYYSKLREIIRSSGQTGHSTWLGPWCETSYYPLQCDFAAMISPDDFNRFVMPSMIRLCDFLDHSIFHLDGPDCIVHLDHLLSISKLDGIQWVPGDGSPPVWDEIWFQLYEKIQAAGKNLVLHGVNTVENVLHLCRNFSAKGLFISISLNSEKEAEDLIAKVKDI